MKKHTSLFLLVLIALPFLASAQRSPEIAFSGGVVNYIGDLANEKNFPFSSAKTGASLTIRNFINHRNGTGLFNLPLDVQIRFSWHRLQYDESSPIGSSMGSDLRNYYRGLGFRNDLFGSEADVTYSIFLNKASLTAKPRISIFFLAGAGIFYGVPKADLFRGDISAANRYYFWNDGTVRDIPEGSKQIGSVIGKDGIYETNLQDWKTEGQGSSGTEDRGRKPYSNYNVGFPVGMGLRYQWSNLVSLSAEFNYYYFLTDYLDDVSNRYATYEELHANFPDPVQFELAKYISDPTGRGTNGFQGPPLTSRRGNPKLKDSFTYGSVEIAYKFGGNKVYGYQR